MTIPNPDYTAARFLGEYPEFVSILEPAIMSALHKAEYANKGVKGEPCRWYLTSTLAAHRLALRFDIEPSLDELGMNDPTSTIQAGSSRSASTSSLSVTEGSAAFQTGDDVSLADLGRTEYGLEYLDWLERCASGSEVLKSPDTSATAKRYAWA